MPKINRSKKRDRKKRVYVRDIHMGAGRSFQPGCGCHVYDWFGPREAKNFSEFLDFLVASADVEEVILLGDTMDNWVCPVDEIPPTFEGIVQADVNKDVVQSLKALAKHEEIKLIYMPGNHDMSITEEFVTETFPGIVFGGSAAVANSDGFGMMWAHSYGNLVTERRSAFLAPTGLERLTTVFHFRTASSGSCSLESHHPHRVHRDLAFAHNGNLWHFGSWFPGNSGKETDTQRFNRLVLQRLPPDFLHREEIMVALERYAEDQMSKFVFMEGSGYVRIVNESSGEWCNGCWYSNRGIENYAGYGYSGAYHYQPGEVRHKGGMTTIQMLPEARRKKWERCGVCHGWFRRESLQAGKCESCQINSELIVYATNTH